MLGPWWVPDKSDLPLALSNLLVSDSFASPQAPAWTSWDQDQEFQGIPILFLPLETEEEETCPAPGIFSQYWGDRRFVHERRDVLLERSRCRSGAGAALARLGLQPSHPSTSLEGERSLLCHSLVPNILGKLLFPRLCPFLFIFTRFLPPPPFLNF